MIYFDIDKSLLSIRNVVDDWNEAQYDLFWHRQVHHQTSSKFLFWVNNLTSQNVYLISPHFSPPTPTIYVDDKFNKPGQYWQSTMDYCTFSKKSGRWCNDCGKSLLWCQMGSNLRLLIWYLLLLSKEYSIKECDFPIRIWNCFDSMVLYCIIYFLFRLHLPYPGYWIWGKTIIYL